MGLLPLLSMVLAQLVPAFSELPVLDPSAQAHYVSSYDRSGGNDDGFRGTYSALYVDDRGEHVIFDARGPGTLFNLWFTSRENGRSPLGWGRLRFYFDGEDSPSIDMDADEFFSGRHPPFAAPFVYHAFQSTGGYVSYLPFPFAERLKITTERRVGFYNAYYHTYAPDRAVTSWNGEEDVSALERLWSRAGDNPNPRRPDEVVTGKSVLPSPLMPDGEPSPSTTLLHERQGAGVVTSLRFNPLFPLTPYQLQHVRLRIYWDGEDDPSVDAPLGHFFGSGLGEASVRAAPLGMSPSGAYYCYLPMPFWRSARFELVNENPTPIPEIWWEIELGDNGYAEANTGYMTARFRKEWPTTEGRDYEILDAGGRGLYLGQMMTVEPLRSEIKRWWEGDLRIRLDGKTRPVFNGTGHEDEYLGGWSNEWLMNPYSLPMHGEPITRDLTQVDFQWSAATSVYRFFVSGIPFQNGIRVTTEHGANNTANAMYSSVAYYYRRPEAMAKLDAVDAPEPSAANPLTSTFTFTLPPSGSYSHLRLRRAYDPGEIQSAELWLNDRRVGTWYDAARDEHAARAESDFLLPASGIGGLTELRFEVRAANEAWSQLGYELWGLK